jgi:4-amino-4-deoxy-L-arabinose transferase-like glycosyltransferase
MDVRRTTIILVLILALQVILRLPFLAVPLDRDEGAYGYIAQRILAGEVPYRDAVDHKPPLIYFLYALLVKFFGSSIAAIRIPTLFYSLVTTGALFCLGALLWGRGAALLSVLLYALFSGGVLIRGTTSNTETFLVLPLILALICFLKGMSKDGPGKRIYYLSAGLFSGTAIMLKPVAIFNFLILLFFLFTLKNNRPGYDLKNAAYLAAGCLLAPLSFVFYFLGRGAFSDFVFGNIIMNLKYLQDAVGGIFIKLRFAYTKIHILIRLENPLLWAFALSGLLYIFARDRSRENLLIAFWALACFAGVASGGLFFGHYFILFIPALCLLSAYALKRLSENAGFYAWTMILPVSLLFFLMILPFQYPFYSKYSPEEISEHQYGRKSYVISYRLAKEFRKFLKPHENILVWSANPELYFYLNKKSPTRYYNYLDWMRDEEVKREIVSSVFQRMPDYIVWTDYALPFEELINLVKNDYHLFLEIEDWKVFKRRR